VSDPAGLAELAAAVSGCTLCPELVVSRSTVVVGDTPPGARLLLVGEAPGATEDEVGRPFVGRSGELLDTLLGEAGLSRSDVAVLNVVKCRPARNRTPTRLESRTCASWLDRQLGLVAPALVVTLGRTALTWAFDAKVTLVQVRGQVHDWRATRLIASYHPSAALRFGPRGAPMAALREDLALASRTLPAAAAGTP
jgi:uracil-DNA glycosylase